MNVNSSFCQIGTTIPANRRVDWTNAGYPGSFPKDFKRTINVKTFGAIGDGKADDTKMIQAAIDAANPSVLTLVYLPAGDYKLSSTIYLIRNNLVLRGAGSDSTRLHFYNASGHCIYITGKWKNDEKSATNYSLNSGNQKDSKRITFTENQINLDSGQYIDLRRDMYLPDICNVPDVCKACVKGTNMFEQVIKVLSKKGNVLELEDGLSINYDISSLKISRINLVQNIAIQNMHLIKDGREPENDSSAYKICIESTANILISGIESSNTAYHHIGILKSTKVEIRGSYFHHSNYYFSDKRGRTDGYGIYIGYGSTDCLIEDNIFLNLRHSVALSISPNRNVIGYNYSGEPLACQSGNCQYEFVIHGYYPEANLFEGNVCGSFDIDTYWGLNGPYNTIFRNKFDKVDLCSAPSINAVGNLIISYQKLGCPDPSDIFKANNNVAGTLADKSLYHTSKPGFLSEKYTWPVIGPPLLQGQSLSNTIPAEARYKSGGKLTVNY